jgi:SAM-dependent methyltransferase
MLSPTVSFDRQAADFDLRAGLPVGVARKVAEALVELVPPGRGVLLDLGAGTGQIGEPLAAVSRERGWVAYVGIDVSGPMLAVFRRKLDSGGGGRGAGLVRADAAVRWPVASGSAGLVFLSRAAHLLPPSVLVAETLRVASPDGAVAAFGGVRADPDSLRAVLRRQMRRLLTEHGVEGRNAKEAQGRLVEALAEGGGEVLPVRAAASWTVVHRAADSLAAWRAKAGLGGRAIAPEVQESVLCRLEDWIRDRYGSLDVEREAIERYEVAAVRLPKSSDRNERGTR